MHPLHTLLPFLLPLLTTAEPSDEPSAAPPAGSVQITGIAFAGVGCPAGSNTGSGPVASADGAGLRLPIPTLVAQAGPGQATVVRSNCQVNLRVQYPAGWQFAIATAEYAGYSRVPEGATGL